MSADVVFGETQGIEDYLNAGDFKNTLRLVKALLTKHKASPYGHAIKALALHGSGKFGEALENAELAKKMLLENGSQNVNDKTMKTLQDIFTRVGHPDWITECYEHATRLLPREEHILEALFNCYVRQYSFSQQQQTAMKLYTQFGKNEKHLLWSVCSNLLQVLIEEKQRSLIELCIKQINKHMETHGLKDQEALMVYIFVLEQQEKFMEAFDFLSGNGASIMMFEFDKLRMQARVLARGGQFGRAASKYEEALALCPDDWECFLHYAACLLDNASTMSVDAVGNPVYPPTPVNCKDLKLTVEEFDSRMRRASTLIDALLSSDENINLRGPYLAKLEIERMKLEYGNGNIDDLVEGLVDYYWRFGCLSCFTSDIESYLPIIDSHGKYDMWDVIQIDLQNLEHREGTTASTLQQGVALFKIKIYGEKLFTFNTNGLYKLAFDMMRLYIKSLPHSRTYDIQEVMNCEELLSMISNVLVQLFWRTKQIGYLLESIMILEFGLTVRSLIWQYKIQLLHLYSFWGCLPRAYAWYKSLDVKNILLESALHHILPQMLVSPLWSDLGHLLGDYLKFMDDYFKESGDMTMFAYKHMNYSKVVEFVQFKQQLELSSQYMVAKIESAILELKQRSSSVKELEDTLQSSKLNCGHNLLELFQNIQRKWTFNEDFELRPWWTPTPHKNYLLEPFENYSPNETMIGDTKASVVKAIDKRRLIPRIIYLSLQCATSSAMEHAEELKLLLGDYVGHLDCPFQEAVELVFEVSSGQESLERLSLNMVDWMNFVVFLNAWNIRSHELDRTKPISTWDLVNSMVKKCIAAKVGSMKPQIESPGNDLPELVQLVSEPLTWHRLIIQSFVLAPTHGKQKKGKAGGKGSNLTRKEIQDSIRSLHDAIGEVTKWLDGQKTDPWIRRDALLSSVHAVRPLTITQPGGILTELEAFIASLNDGAQVGERIFNSCKSWSARRVAEELVSGQDRVIDDFLDQCTTSLNILQALKL